MSAWKVPGYTGARELGAGTGGRVALAVRDTTGTPVAVRFLAAGLWADTGFARHFRGDVHALRRLDSPYVARVIDYVVTEEGAALVTELVRGVPLRAVLRRAGGGLAPEAALVVLRDGLLGLADGHGVGVVHRRVRSTNVLVTAEGEVKLADFAVAPRDRDTPVEGPAAGYRSPEQWGGEPASPAGDVYALTVVFFECLTGARPYPGEDAAELAVQHITAPVPEEAVPAPLRELVRAGLAKDPARRPESAAEFAARVAASARDTYGPEWEGRGRRRLAAAAALTPEAFPPAVTEPAAGPVVPVASKEEGRGDAPDRRRPRHGWLAGAAALLVVGGTVAVTATTGGDERAAGPRSAPSGSPSPGTPSTASTGADEARARNDLPGPSGTPGARTTAPRGDASSPAGPRSPHGSARADRSATGSGHPTAADEPSPSTNRVVTPRVREVRTRGLSRATATVEVVADTTRPVTVTITWHRSGDAGTLGEQDGEGETFELRGDTRYELTVDHRFGGLRCYWAVRVVTSPAADEPVTEQVEAPLCALP